MYVCMYACMYVCMYVYIYMYINRCMHIYINRLSKLKSNETIGFYWPETLRYIHRGIGGTTIQVHGYDHTGTWVQSGRYVGTVRGTVG